MIKIKDEMGHHQNYFTGSELCRIIQLRDNKGKLMGRTKFYKRMRSDKFLLDSGLLPQSFLDLNLGITYETVKKHHKYICPLWSEIGVDFLKQNYNVPLSLPNDLPVSPKKESVPKVTKSINSGDLIEILTDDEYNNYMINKYGYRSAAYQSNYNSGEHGDEEDDKV